MLSLQLLLLQLPSFQPERACHLQGWAAEGFTRALGDHADGDHPIPEDSDAVQLYPVPQQSPARLRQNAATVDHGDKEDAGAASADVEEDGRHGVGCSIAIQVADDDLDAIWEPALAVEW